jgi:hypothetical protein
MAQTDGGNRDFMDAPYARTLAVGVAWNWFCTVYGRGTFAHVTFTLLSIFSVGIPLAIFGTNKRFNLNQFNDSNSII